MKQETGRLKEILHVLNQHNVTHGINPEKLCSILEDLGPTYVKLGQIMSMRSDILPEKYCHELARLRTDVKPMSFNEIWKILNKELHNDPGQLFQKINQIPVGCASIAQVHEAVLGDGSKVVLKIQRPQIKQIMAEDIALLKKASGFLNFATGTGELIDFRKVIDELWETSKEEMDFEKEAQHLERFYENQKDVAYVTCPKVYKEYSNEHLLVMSYVDGIQIDHIEELDRNGYDRKEIAQKTAQNYCKQILADGFFHADPHPGNLWISGGQIVWLDLGMAGDLSEHYRAIMKRAITAILKNDIYEIPVADAQEYRGRGPAFLRQIRAGAGHGPGLRLDGPRRPDGGDVPDRRRVRGLQGDGLRVAQRAAFGPQGDLAARDGNAEQRSHGGVHPRIRRRGAALLVLQASAQDLDPESVQQQRRLFGVRSGELPLRAAREGTGAP